MKKNLRLHELNELLCDAVQTKSDEFNVFFKQILELKQQKDIEDDVDWDDVYYVAAYNANLPALELLLINAIYSEYPANLLYTAISSGSVEMVELVIRHENKYISEENRCYRSMAFVRAAETDIAWANIMQALLDAGAIPDDAALVDWPADDGKVEKTKWIQEHFKFKSENWDTTLITAVRNHQWKLVDYLLSAIRDIEPSNLNNVIEKYLSTRLGLGGIEEFNYLRKKYMKD